MTVGVTGGSGVVGRSVVRHLVARGDRVRALSRSSRSAETLRGLGAIPVDGDLQDRASLVDAFSGCDLVFNVAGVNQMCVRDTRPMEDVNVTGALNVLRAADAAGVRRLVHTSSAVTIGEARGTVGVESSAHRGYFLSAYERTKFLGERALLAEPATLEVVVVNPSSVQGPGRATGTGRIILDVVNGDLRFLVDSVISLVDIDDCARGHLLAADRGTPGERYILSGPVLTVEEAVAMAARAAGRRLRPWVVPGGLVTAAVSVVEPVARLLGRDMPFCREMVRVMRFGHRYDGSRAALELGLGYTPAESTVARLIDWFDAEGLLGR